MKRLVLVGGGHAHLEVLRQAARRRFDGGEITVITPSARSHYTGMLPGFVQGTFAESELTFDIAALARSAGAAFIEARATRVAEDGAGVEHDSGSIDCDVVSLDVGSAAAGTDTQGVREHAHGARPLRRVRALVAALEGMVARRDDSDSIAVVGGGAGGVEIAFAIRARLEGERLSNGITVLDAEEAILPEVEPAVRLAVQRELARREIDVRVGQSARRVTASEIITSNGERIPATLTVWVTGAAPVPLADASPLPTDDRGFWLVDRTLRSQGGAPVFGAGDCVSLAHAPWVPKAGVYAVRAAPILAANLRAFVARGESARLLHYEPQRKFLAIYDLGDGRAIARWMGRAWSGRLPLLLKRLIDRRFVRRYAVR